MRRIHLIVGLLTIAGFLITGQIMLHRSPPMGSLDAATRLLYRSRHIYLLASGALNSMLGLYYQRRWGWRSSVQTTGSVLLTISPFLLGVAFGVEPAHGFHPDLPWSSLGLFALFAGSVLHVIAAIGAAPDAAK